MLDALETAESGKPLALHAGIATWPVIDEAEPEALRHRALHRLGRILERDGFPEVALDTYQRSDQYPSTERTVRLLLNTGRRDEAEAHLRRLIDDPSCDAELLFAEDFLERKFHKKKQGRLTAFLRSAPFLLLDESGRDRPEAAAVSSLRREGAEATHSENRIWLQLFGLLFWDLLFGPELASLHDPFDFTPQDLATGTFFERHRVTIHERFALLDDPESALALLDATWIHHCGEPNSLVTWDEPLYTFTRALLTKAPRGGLAAILEAMARDHRRNRSGFPDLIILENGGVRFLEIKTEGDQIRRQQLVQIERLSRAGFEVGLANVRWFFDAGQEYVVVDLETTGGDPTSHRITEIGAVKVRDGRIVAEWSSLVRPGRRIPSFIVKLTGITDEMVSTAPEFATIAGELRAFIGDSVFVAHRAKFDHGFLKSEFDRVGIRLAGPVLCTVVEMKRHFPGLPSYGLGALSAHFGISLESHHRALCDARATAELLLRINQKRLASHSSDSGHLVKAAQKRD
jgi:DNA polymerase-3 subunit epsilon